MAGANSIFTGERETLLVTPNPGISEDMQMLQTLGLKPMKREVEKVTNCEL
jgi:biotin synthase